MKADLDDKQSLFSAFQGASAIFANTDFFAPLYSALADETLSPGRSPKEYAYDVEVSQGVSNSGELLLSLFGRFGSPPNVS